MQPYPKKSNRPLPDDWDLNEIIKQLESEYDELFGEHTDENGVLKITPEVIRKVISESR